MNSNMPRLARSALTEAVRSRYRASSGKAKRRILDEFIAATGYHEKSAIRVLNASPTKVRRTRRKSPLYDEAARAALIVLWEASDRVCSKRLKALVPMLLAALERNGHLRLNEDIRSKVLSMSAATIDRLLQAPRSATRLRKAPRATPEPRRRIRMRTFADWHEPPPGSVEMDLVAHCGDNGTEFVNDRLIEYCLGNGIELTRSRPYRKNDQAWIEQKNGAVVRKLLGYRRFEGLAAARAITRLYAASRLFVNFFQPSFKLAAKHRDGAKVFKRYHPPQTPCERLLQAENIPTSTQDKLREIATQLDPLKLLEEMRAMQAHLAALADGEVPPPATSDPPNLAAFVASLSSAWHAGEVRPTFSVEAKPLYLRSLQKVSAPMCAATPIAGTKPPPSPPRTTSVVTKLQEIPQVVYAEKRASAQALRMVWPIACRRLEGLPNINARQLFEELCVQFPGRFSRKQYRTLLRRVNLWRKDARARGVEIGPKTYRRFSDKPRGCRPDAFADHWAEMAECLEANPDQTALELLVEFQVRYPGQYSQSQLRTLQKRVKTWRRHAVERLINEAGHHVRVASRNFLTICLK